MIRRHITFTGYVQGFGSAIARTTRRLCTAVPAGSGTNGTGQSRWKYRASRSISEETDHTETERGTRMETKYYVVSRIDGDYAWLKRTDAEEEPLFIARALLPEAIDEGIRLKYEMLQYEII